MPVDPAVCSQILSRTAPGGSYDCGPATVVAALHLNSGGLFRIGNRSRRIWLINLVRSRGGMSDGPGGTSIEEQATAFRAFDGEFNDLGLGDPKCQLVRGGNRTDFHSKLAAGKSAMISIGYGPIDAYHGHAISGTWGFTGNHAAIATDLRNESGTDVVTYIDPLHDGRYSTSGYMTHSGYVPRGGITIPLSLLDDAMEAYHGRGTYTYAAFTAPGVAEPSDTTDGSGESGTDYPNETHPGYPGRGSWDFHNITQGYHFWPTLDSIEISDGRPDELATFNGTVVDQAGDMVVLNEDEIEVTFDGDTIFAGDVSVPAGSYLSRVGPRMFDISAQDYTARLDDNVIDDGVRHAESATARINWIMSFCTRGITHGLIDPPDQDMDKTDYTGQTVREALDSVIADLRCSYYVDFDKKLHLFRTEAITGAFNLNDDDPDYGNSFPFWEYQIAPDSTELHDRVFVQADKKRRNSWETDYAWTAAHSIPHQERALSDSELKTSGAVTRAGQRDLDQFKSPTITGSCDLAEPDLVAGTTVNVKSALFPEFTANYILTNVTITAIDPHDEGGNAQMRVHVEFKDRRKGGKGRHTDIINKLTRHRPDNDPVPAAEMCDDDIITIGATSAAQEGLYLAFDYGVASPPLLSDALDHVTTSAQNGCAAGLGGYGPGGVRKEAWYDMGLGAIPDEWLGILIHFDAVASGDMIGVADGGTAFVGVGFSIPTGMGQYSPVGSINLATGGDVFIPRSMLTPSATNHIVVAPAWYADMSLFYCAEDLSDPTHGPAYGGEANSGQSAAPDATAVARVFCGDGLSEWVPGIGDVDGVNDTFTLINWSGEGSPEARVGALVGGVGDFIFDPVALTVTFTEPPFEHADVRFRYDVAV